MFTLKYAPKHSNHIIGQDSAMRELKDFVQNYKNKKHKAILLHGAIGTGKTASVYALAEELGYDLLELNSGDQRNADGITRFLSSALGQQSLFMTPKMVLIDEIDTIGGVRDRGCIPALLKAIAKSKYPVILTANDPFDQKYKNLRKNALMVEFPKLQYQDLAILLTSICEKESIQFEEKAINSLARQADGDVRSALIDLHLCKDNMTFDAVSNLSDRKRVDSILQALAVIFKSSRVDNALPALKDVNVELRDVMFWIDHNLPKEYVDATSLARAYEHLARADIFQRRIMKRQHWRFLAYINNLLTAGISSAKEKRNTEFVKYMPTMRFLSMWQAKMRNAKKNDIASRLAEKTHTSTKVAREQIPYLQKMFQHSINNGIVKELDLSDDEVAWLSKT